MRGDVQDAMQYSVNNQKPYWFMEEQEEIRVVRDLYVW